MKKSDKDKLSVLDPKFKKEVERIFTHVSDSISWISGLVLIYAIWPNYN